MRALYFFICFIYTAKLFATPVFPITTQDLIDAIDAFNSGTQDVIIDLSAGQPFSLLMPDNGFNGLPVITNTTNKLLIQNGLIQRTAVDPIFFRFFEIDPGANLSLSDVTLINGDTDSNPIQPGGAILVEGTLASVTNSTFRNNHALFGGAVKINPGGIIGLVSNSTFDANRANLGGAITIEGTLSTIQLSVFTANRALSGGAIHVNLGGDIGMISNTHYVNNFANGSGGALSIGGHLGAIESCVFSKNSSLSGGAVAVISDRVTAGPGLVDLINNCIFVNNAARFNGGAIEGSTNVLSRPRAIGALRLCTFDTHSASLGGVIYLQGVGLGSIDSSTFIKSTAQLQGGVIFSGSSRIDSIENSTFAQNQVTGVTGGDLADGGVIYLASENILGTVIPSSIESIDNSTFSGNKVAQNGGVIALLSEGGEKSVYIENFSNNTVADNTAGGLGGAFYLPYRDSIPNLISTIVAKNTATQGGPDVSDVLGAIANERFNLIGNNSGSHFIAGTPNSNQSYVGTPENPIDPLLAPLGNNGGPTQTRALLPFSPAINSGTNPLNLLFDQRGIGFARMSGPETDIGAFEVQIGCPDPDHNHDDNDDDDDNNHNTKHKESRNKSPRGRGLERPLGPFGPVFSPINPVLAPLAPVILPPAPPSDNLASSLNNNSEPELAVKAEGCSSIRGKGYNNLFFIVFILIMAMKRIYCQKAGRYKNKGSNL